MRQFLQFVLAQQPSPVDYSFSGTSGPAILFVPLHSCDGMHMCVCICQRIREWNPGIYSLEFKVCVLSIHRARNVSQTHCNNFERPDQSVRYE